MAIELQEDEVIEKEVKGAYWEKFLFFYNQTNGDFTLTNKRILFRGFATELDISYSDIESVGPCNIGPLFQILPAGFKVTTRDGKSYKLVIWKRKDYIEYIQSKL